MIVKPVMTAMLAMIAAYCACGEGEEVELPVEVSNPGFEDGTAGWNFKRNMSVVSDNPHSGKSCAFINMSPFDQNGLYITQLVPVDSGADYGAECFIRTEEVKAEDRIRQGSCGATLIVEWYNSDRIWIASGQYATGLFGTKEWTKVRASQLKAPQDAGYASIYLALRGNGKAWFDDVRFFKRVKPVEKTEPADGAELTTNTPRFGWKYRPGVRSFSLVLSKNPAFPKNDSIIYPVGGFYDYQLEQPLAPGKWHWKVVSKGQEHDDAWSFTVADNTAGKDTLAPRLMSRAKRVTSAQDSFAVRLREQNGVPKAEFIGVPGACTEIASGEFRCRFKAPKAGWPKGFHEGVVKVCDVAGNRAEHVLYFLNAPKPENAVVVGADGMFHEKGKKIFPLGIYEVAPKYMAEVRKCGYDVVHTYQWEWSQDDGACRKYLDDCWKTDGLRAFIGFVRGNGKDVFGVKQGNFAHTARRVGALADHPGLFCWYLFDEPEHYGQFATPDMLTAHADIVRALDPFHPVVMSTWDRNMHEHRRTWDTHWTQAYGTPAKVVGNIDAHRKYIGCSSPITTLLSCYDQIQTDALRRKDKVDPLATKFQRDIDWFRACAYLAIVKETNGIWWWWFARDAKDYVNASQVPQAWADLTSVNREIIALRPLIFADGPVTTGRAMDGDSIVEWWAKVVDGRLFAILVNTAEKPVSVEVDLPLIGRRRYELKRFEVLKVKEM
jgi:hypothetical protein